MDQYKTYKIPYQGRNYSIDYSAEPKEQSGSGDDFEEESSGVDDACMCECGNQDYCEALSGEEDDDDDVESDDSSVSGTRDPAENISDNGGVRMAYRAFQLIEGRRRQECVADLPFSARQLFWVGVPPKHLDRQSHAGELRRAKVFRGLHLAILQPPQC